MSEGNGNGKSTVIDGTKWPIEMPFHFEKTHATESSSVIRERTYDREMDINYLLGLLRNQRVTGTLRIDISQGGVCNVRLEERQKLAP